MISRAIGVSIVLLILALPVRSQSEPYTVYDTRPVILEGPYLVATGETTATIVWFTDTPSHAQVRYGTDGDLTEIAEPLVDGLVPVGTRHVVHLENLSPGTTYEYEVLATRVVRLNAYWPEKGLDVRGGPYRFTTFDPGAPSVSFSVFTDTHEDARLIDSLNALIDWDSTDFLVHAGDAFHWLDHEEQVFRAWLRPTISALDHAKPLFFVRGNHEMRGPFARAMRDYVPTPEGRFYYARDVGPVHLIVLDTGEDKPDSTNVYAQLNRTESYRADELAWFREHVAMNARIADAPFRVILMHDPRWGWLADGPDAWVQTANDANVNLVVAGHRHRYSYTPPGPDVDHSYHLLVVGTAQIAQVVATTEDLRVTVTALDGSVVDRVTIPHTR